MMPVVAISSPAALALAILVPIALAAEPARWRQEWPQTDFARTAVPWSEIRDGGPPKDGIPPIDAPRFRSVDVETGLAPTEPGIAFEWDGDARAYPLRVLIWHEIVNDVVGGLPVAVTYCPLCNAAIVFDRRVGGDVLDFGTTGKLRRSDLVMYDRQTESWWQQYSGAAIVGTRLGQTLTMLPSRLESWARFAARVPHGRVLQPSDPLARPYGSNPYVGYDSAPLPFLYDGEVPEGIEPLARVVVVGNEAWALDLLQRSGRIEQGDLVLEWAPGQASALDSGAIAAGRDVGNVTVVRRTPAGPEDLVHHVTFAFVFHAFQPDGRLHR
jgi:hypothetical protein